MRGGQYVMLKDRDDVVAVNIRKKLGVSVRDVQFIKPGAPAITLTGVKDRYSLVEMANAIQPGLEELAAPAYTAIGKSHDRQVLQPVRAPILAKLHLPERLRRGRILQLYK